MTTKPMFIKAGPLFDWECTVPAEPAPAVPKAKRTRRKLAPQDSTGKAGLEHFLQQRQVPYVAVNEAKKAIFAGSSLEAFDFLVYCDDGPNHLVLVIYQSAPTAEQDALLSEWEKVFGPAFVGIFARRLAAGTWAYILRGSGEPWTEYLPIDA